MFSIFKMILIKSIYSQYSTLFERIANNAKTPSLLSLIYLMIILFIGLIYHDVGSYKVGSENDFFGTYIPHAKEILKGNFPIDDYRGPLYIILLAILGFAIGNFLSAGIVISTISASAALYFIYKILLKLINPIAALVIILFTAFNHTFVEYTYGAGTDMLFNASLTALLYVLIKNENKTWSKVIKIAIISSIAYLTRYNAIFLIFAVPAGIFLMNKNETVKKNTIMSVGYVLIFFICIMPWGIYTLIQKGEILYNKNYQNIAISIDAESGINWEKEYLEKAQKYSSYSELIINEPLPLLKTISLNLFYHLYFDLKNLIGWHLSIFFLPGIFVFIKQKSPPVEKVFFIFNIFFFIVLLPVYYSERFSLFLIPAFIVIIYEGVKRITNYLNNYLKAKWVFQIVIIGLLYWSLIKSIGYNSLIIKGPPDIPVISKRFEELQLPSDSKMIASRKPHIAYHLNLIWTDIPVNSSLEKTINELKNRNVDYLYISTIEWTTRPALRNLLESKKEVSDLEPIIIAANQQAVLYRIK